MLTHTADTVYTFKAMYLQSTPFVKAWEKGTEEPAEWMGSAEVEAEYGNPFTVYYEARSNSTSKYVQYSATIDNLKVDSVKLEVAGLTPASGLFMKVGKTAAVKVKYDTDLTVSGTVDAKVYSDNPSVADVSADGTVTAVSSGIATIVAECEGKTYRIQVTVL